MFPKQTLNIRVNGREPKQWCRIRAVKIHEVRQKSWLPPWACSSVRPSIDRWGIQVSHKLKLRLYVGIWRISREVGATTELPPSRFWGKGARTEGWEIPAINPETAPPGCFPRASRGCRERSPLREHGVHSGRVPELLIWSRPHSPLVSICLRSTAGFLLVIHEQLHRFQHPGIYNKPSEINLKHSNV